jgi:hypothetical protein
VDELDETSVAVDELDEISLLVDELGGIPLVLDEIEEMSLLVDEAAEMSPLVDEVWATELLVIDTDVLAGTLLTGSVDEILLLTPAAWLPLVSTVLL